MLKSIGVVLGSYVLSVILVMFTDPLLSHIFPGDFIKGRGRVGRHILWFMILGEAMGIGSIIPNWNKGWPHLYWLSWLLTWPVSCWIGLQVGRRRTG
jgi:hypothetical protein